MNFSATLRTPTSPTKGIKSAKALFKKKGVDVQKSENEGNNGDANQREFAEDGGVTFDFHQKSLTVRLLIFAAILIGTSCLIVEVLSVKSSTTRNFEAMIAKMPKFYCSSPYLVRVWPAS